MTDHTSLTPPASLPRTNSGIDAQKPAQTAPDAQAHACERQSSTIGKKWWPARTG
ncbi:hypothetical protein [Pseudovibrio sp. Ad13]|uniref:hypothetical protein n=1 Tax=Pseudovibrio sp. Ad13 TaxID=989396 RepID=UPI000AFD38BA|nr:hypothetical protein [Pseudovibrio sp. Ad13]